MHVVKNICRSRKIEDYSKFEKNNLLKYRSKIRKRTIKGQNINLIPVA